MQFFKYLGCFLSSSGSYAKCISELTNSARKALFSLKKYFVYNPEIFPITQIKLFNSMVVPIMNYGSEVWGLRKADPMEKFHRSFLKYILRVKIVHQIVLFILNLEFFHYILNGMNVF